MARNKEIFNYVNIALEFYAIKSLAILDHFPQDPNPTKPIEGLLLRTLTNLVIGVILTRHHKGSQPWVELEKLFIS